MVSGVPAVWAGPSPRLVPENAIDSALFKGDELNCVWKGLPDWSEGHRY
jgi:hypothetical protein